MQLHSYLELLYLINFQFFSNTTFTCLTSSYALSVFVISLATYVRTWSIMKNYKILVYIIKKLKNCQAKFYQGLDTTDSIQLNYQFQTSPVSGLIQWKILAFQYPGNQQDLYRIVDIPFKFTSSKKFELSLYISCYRIGHNFIDNVLDISSAVFVTCSVFRTYEGNVICKGLLACHKTCNNSLIFHECSNCDMIAICMKCDEL